MLNKKGMPLQHTFFLSLCVVDFAAIDHKFEYSPKLFMVVLHSSLVF